MPFRLPHTAGLALALVLAGCGGGKADKPAAAAPDEFAGNGSSQADPAIRSALADQIMVDPALTQQRDGGTRPGATAQAPIPSTLPGADAGNTPTLGEVAQAQAAGKAATNPACYQNLQYSAGWAQRLPAALPLPADAQVREAAGNATGGCNVRVVSFASATPIDRVTEFYTAAGRRGGYAVEATSDGAGRAVGGDKGADAFFVTLRPRGGGGTEADIVANHGR